MKQNKTLDELTLLDRFLFAQTMEHQENVQLVLEIIMGRDVALKYLPQTEKEQRTSSQKRFVKLDVWSEDINNVIYDTEVQKKNTGNLPKRSRYYQSMIDSGLLKPGAADFNEMNSVVIILISPFDLFGEDRYCYTFSMMCEEVDGLRLDDGATRIFLNTHGKDEENISPELKELLYLFENTNDQVWEIQSKKVKQLKRNVELIQNNADVGVKYMQEWEERVLDKKEAREEGRAEGLALGIAKGKTEGLAEGLAKGRTNGKAEGKILERIDVLTKMKRRGWVLSQITELYEGDEENISYLYGLIEANPRSSCEELAQLAVAGEI